MHDVIVIGSGGTGLSAALTAACTGAQALVEKFVRTAAEMARLLELNRPIAWQAITAPSKCCQTMRRSGLLPMPNTADVIR